MQEVAKRHNAKHAQQKMRVAHSTQSAKNDKDACGDVQRNHTVLPPSQWQEYHQKGDGKFLCRGTA
jgi:hypothetical protein